ncbi:MAG: purine-binding chemotaxis protein CheW [Deltaproteobacteria bacterium]|nr:purine-binding chemotaxis protein CheW [Deltaproteobacteria bacterium]
MDTQGINHLIVGWLDSQRYALRLGVVERIVRAVEVTPLPHAPEIVQGVVDIEGVVIPVVNVRRRLGLPERPIALNDRFIVIRTRKRPVIVVLDTVQEILEISAEQIMTAEQIVPRSQHLAGVVKLSDGMIFIHDLDQFLSLDEEQSLNHALLQA